MKRRPTPYLSVSIHWPLDVDIIFTKVLSTPQLTLASGCYVYGAHITVTLDCGFAVGLYNPHTGTARVYDCVITAISASGEAAAFHLNYGGDVIFHETMLFGSGTDHGYSGYDGAGGGKAYVFDCDLYASSAPDYFNV